MAGLMSRTSAIAQAKFSKLLDRAENPGETLDYSYEQQLHAAPERQARHRRRDDGEEAARARGVLDPAAARQARRPGPAGARRPAARTSRARRSRARRRSRRSSTRSTPQEQQLDDQEQKLIEGEQTLQTKIEAFRSQKEVIKAQYSAAEAQVKIGEAATGIGEHMADVGLAIQRAQDKTAGDAGARRRRSTS